MNPDQQTIRVVVADDHEIVRRGLCMLITSAPDLNLVGEAGTGQQTIEVVSDTQPHVVLLDIQMPDGDGIVTAQTLRTTFPSVVVLMLTSFSDDARLHAALRAGAQGYLLKNIGGDDLMQAIRGAARGEPQLHPDIARRLMDEFPAPADPLAHLTAREREVLQLVATGMSNKEIGVALTLSSETVRGYVNDILQKLQVADRTQATLVAIRYGLVHIDNLPSS